MDSLRNVSGRWGAVGFVILLVALLGALVMARRQVQAQAGRPNVIFIVVDALRPDHLSGYGYERPTSPNLDAFMASGARFAEATSTSSWTYPSNAAMLTGLLPSHIGVKDWASPPGVVPAERTLLAELLHDAGYQNVGFVTNYFLWPQFGLNQGFDFYDRLNGSERAEDLNQMAFDWLTEHPDAGESQPLFLYMYYYDSHSWYDPPAPYDTLYDPTYTGPLTPELYGHGRSVIAGDLVLEPRDVEYLLALYDGEITYWDIHFQQLMDRLAAEGLLENALVVVTSDHGEMFGEHGKWLHGNSLYEEVLRVPLLIRYPGVVAAGRVSDTPVTTADLMPTVLDLLNLPVPDGLDSLSLKPLLTEEPGAFAERPIYAEMNGEVNPTSISYGVAPTYHLRSIKEGNRKYILAFGVPEENVLYQVEPNSLYEGENIIADYPAQAEDFYYRLYSWFQLPTQFRLIPVMFQE